VLWNDWNANGVIEPNVTQSIDGVNHGEQVTYTFDGTTLRRQESNIDAAAVVVTDRVSDATITYFDEGGNALANPSSSDAPLIRTVVLDITTTPDTTVAGTATKADVRLQNRVRVRNR
jgi:hypothetical protein